MSLDRRLICFMALMLFSATRADAVPLTWNLSGVTFADGGTATGSFTFDASANAFPLGSGAFTVAGGSTSVFPPLNYGNAFTGAVGENTFLGSAPFQFFENVTGAIPGGGTRLLQIDALSNLTDSGGSVGLCLGEGIQPGGGGGPGSPCLFTSAEFELAVDCTAGGAGACSGLSDSVLAVRRITGGELEATPEPAPLVLLGTTLAWIGLRARWRRRRPK
jgi:hypothetical protein